MKRTPVILFLLALGGWLVWLYFQHRLPPGMVAKGPEDWQPRIELATGVISMLAALVNLYRRILDARIKQLELSARRDQVRASGGG